jgi:hypothetical protein
MYNTVTSRASPIGRSGRQRRASSAARARAASGAAFISSNAARAPSFFGSEHFVPAIQSEPALVQERQRPQRHLRALTQ